jgi:hypothetical protein
MPIPELNAEGLLPPGVHQGSVAEIGERFGQFRETDDRVRLQAGLVAALIVNGSFTTGKARPGDVDLIVILRAEANLATDFRPDQYNVLSARRVRSRYAFDVRYATEAPETLEPVIEFFAQVRERPGLRKGMVKVTL